VPDRVLLVTIDTLRADHVGCYGAQHARTPVLDTLAAAGVRFTAAVSPAPLTLPSHASLMTGLDPPGHGVRHNAVHRLAEGLPTLAERMRAAGFASGAFVGSLVLDRRFGLARGFDAYDDHMEWDSSKLVGFAERPADRVVDAALAWLARAPQRFFLWVHFYDPHADHIPPKGFAAAFASRPYDGEIAFADLQLGRLLDGVRARFGGDGLLVAVTSDHGESLGEHGERTHSYSVYEATQRVPLILSGAGMPRGLVVDAPVGLIDVAPTLLAAIGAPPVPDADGRDLAPLLGGGRAPERALYVETLATWLDYGWSPLVGLRTQGFKYIRAPRRELYDLRSDPAELNNVADASPELVERLDGDLERRLERAGRTSEAAALEPEDRARLESLGYVVPGGAAVGPRLDRGVGPDPKDEVGLLARVADAQLHAQRGRFRDGLDLLRDIESPPTHLSMLRGALAYNAGEYALAASDAARAVAAEPRRADAVLLYGSALEKQGDTAGARTAYERAVALMPRSEEGWRGVSRTAQAQGDERAAQAASRRADELEQEASAAVAVPE
jgi:arylsulfatase A-like enzyme